MRWLTKIVRTPQGAYFDKTDGTRVGPFPDEVDAIVECFKYWSIQSGHPMTDEEAATMAAYFRMTPAQQARWLAES